MRAGNDLQLGAAGLVQGRGVRATAGRDLLQAGTLLSTAGARMEAARRLDVHGRVGAAERLEMHSQGQQHLGANGRVEADAIRMTAARDLSLAGTVRANQGVHLESDGSLVISGSVAAANGLLEMLAGQDLLLFSSSSVLGRQVQANAGGNLHAQGSLSSLTDLSLVAARTISLGGQIVAGGSLLAQAGEGLISAGGSSLRAATTLQADAAWASLAGQWVAGQSADVHTRHDLRVDGSVLAGAGSLKVSSGGNMLLGSSSVLQAGQLLNVQASGQLLSSGKLLGGTGLQVSSGSLGHVPAATEP